MQAIYVFGFGIPLFIENESEVGIVGSTQTLLLREMNLTSNVAIPKSSTVGRSATIKPSRVCRLLFIQEALLSTPNMHMSKQQEEAFLLQHLLISLLILKPLREGEAVLGIDFFVAPFT
ncbi:hypothetical protein Dimus_016573 [Dionaea muscipula]